MGNSDDILIECSRHGTGSSAIVCQHLLQEKNRFLAFMENSLIPGDRQAWCGDCEALFLQEKELTETFTQFNNFAVVCEECYDEIKARHTKQDAD
ncbi:MAG: hypothetical protein NTV80_25440 [Verrucomicrobia bacterium]|nr:hypothetical protein [Verrucomicrobiota bacterium]